MPNSAKPELGGRGEPSSRLAQIQPVFGSDHVNVSAAVAPSCGRPSLQPPNVPSRLWSVLPFEPQPSVMLRYGGSLRACFVVKGRVERRLIAVLSAMSASRRAQRAAAAASLVCPDQPQRH